MKNKRLAMVSFTPGGKELADRLADMLGDSEFSGIETVHRPITFREWMEENFQRLDALVFIGAMGIIVREMAPLLKGKTVDPAVVVLDEKGQFVISVLSGHLGGANELTERLAAMLGAAPVITTASDVNKKLAVDSCAKKNGLVISSMEQAKKCAAKIVSGAPVSFLCQGPVFGKIPEEIKAEPSEAAFHICVSGQRMEPKEDLLQLLPKAFVVGIGCKRGTSAEQIERRIGEELEKQNIDLRSVLCLASIDLKKDDEGLLEFSGKNHLPVHFYSAEELLKAEGSFTPSAFVLKAAGVDNVCERAAFLAAREQGSGNASTEQDMILRKSGKDGVTAAIMKIDWSVCFE